MAYIILTAHGDEIERRELARRLVIGRSAACDVSVHDILMSRQHCRIEPAKPGGWKIVDLGSKNGTYFQWSRIAEHKLVDGECLRMGRVSLTYMAGSFVPSPSPARNKIVRPADPHEALAGTVSDFVYAEPEEHEEEFDATPSPVGAAAQGVDVLEEISSSWDSIVATTTRTHRLARPRPMPKIDSIPGTFHYQRRMTDLSLQVSPLRVPYLEIVPIPPRRRRPNIGLAIALTIGVCLATAAVLVSGWALSG